MGSQHPAYFTRVSKGDDPNTLYYMIVAIQGGIQREMDPEMDRETLNPIISCTRLLWHLFP